MFDESFKAGFRTRGGADGDTIERVIEALYTRLSEAWSGAILVDGGAHVGRHTFPMAGLPNVAQVIAVEANDATFGRLARKIKDSPSAGKIRAVHAALQNDPDRREVTFVKSPTHPGRSGINPILQHNRKTTFDPPMPVPATTIDRIMAQAPGSCPFIKLDLEGGEYFALRGASNTLRDHRPVLFFENGKDAPVQNDYTLEDFSAYLGSVGYDFLTIFCEPMTQGVVADYWYAWATPKETRGANVSRVQSLIAANQAAASGPAT